MQQMVFIFMMTFFATTISTILPADWTEINGQASCENDFSDVFVSVQADASINDCSASQFFEEMNLHLSYPFNAQVATWDVGVDDLFS